MPEALTTNENNCEGLKATCCRKVAIRCQWADYCVAPHVVWWLNRFGRVPARPRAPVSRVHGKIGPRIVPHHDLARRCGLPSLSYRLGQMSHGATPIASASNRSMAGQGCFSALPAAVG
jgi:hypothetical protein